MKMLILSMILIAFPWVSHAAGYYKRGHDDFSFWQAVEDRQCRQSDRIDRGIENGQLTRREIKKLRREQKYVIRKIRKYRRHRYLSYQDQRELMHALDYVSDQIRYFKHNGGHDHRRHNHNPFVHHNNRWNEGNNQNSAWMNRHNHSAGLYFRF